MSEFLKLETNLGTGAKSRSMGLKLIVVCALALLMTIPAIFVHALVEERTRRSAEVADEIGAHVGGRQSFLGPTLVVPYSVAGATKDAPTTYGTYFIFPAQADAEVKTHTEERHRSLFRVPVYEAQLMLGARFDLKNTPVAAPAGAQMDWTRAEVVVGAKDARGALADATVVLNGKTLTLAPGGLADDVTFASDEGRGARYTLFGTRIGDVARPGAEFQLAATLKFSGAQRIAILAYGKSTQVKMAGDWPNPSFDGGFLPVARNITPQGFKATWSVPYIARGVRAEGVSAALQNLSSTTLGVSFVELADPYQSVNRAVKYALLFVGLVFLSYFVFEITSGKRIHPAQYVLVGVAQTIFYLLLLSLAERTGFDWGFLLAGGATVTLLALNAAWMFASRAQGLRAFACFALLYALIYLLLRLEDNALLVGAVASFAAIAGVMYFTRKLDWYGNLPPVDAPTDTTK